MAKVEYMIMHTEAKYAIDGKDHYRILQYKGKQDALGGKFWEDTTGKSYSTKSYAEKKLNEIKKATHQ